MKVRLPKSGNPSMNSMQQLMLQAQKAQEEMEKESSRLDEKEYIAISGGEAVKVTVSGKLEVKNIEIKPEVVDPDDVDMLSDMIIAATNEAIKKATTEKDSVLQQISGKMNIPGMF